MLTPTTSEVVEPLEYHKIPGPFKRQTEGPKKNELIWGDWSQPEFKYLKFAPWRWTEKLDGTNLRIHWDGHRPSFWGRTSRAVFPPGLEEYLTETFPEELFEQTFGETPVTLYGEGVGAGIQKGTRYGDKHFQLFDVKIYDWWLERKNVEGVAKSLGIKVVPDVFPTSCSLYGGIFAIQDGLESQFGGYAEGLVGVPCGGFLTRGGKRIIVKVKHVDFFGKDFDL